MPSPTNPHQKATNNAQNSTKSSTSGQMLTEAGGIQQRAVDFYSHLYDSEYTEDEGAFNSLCSGLPRVPEETNKEL